MPSSITPIRPSLIVNSGFTITVTTMMLPKKRMICRELSQSARPSISIGAIRITRIT